MLAGDGAGGSHSSGGQGGRATATVEEVLAFWFAPGGEKRWFEADPAVDDEIARRFGATVAAALAGELAAWAGSPDGALALCLLLDQFPRNIWRGTPRAFCYDTLARKVASDAIAAGHDRAVPASRHLFFYLPFEHSEDLADQKRCMTLMRALGDPEQLGYARRHHDVIARFGRFPHRNAILGRESTEDELVFLQQPGSSF